MKDECLIYYLLSLYSKECIISIIVDLKVFK